MKKIILILAAITLLMAGCTPRTETPETQPPQWRRETSAAEKETDSGAENSENRYLSLSVDGTPLKVEWENNESVEAVKELAEKGDLTIEAHQYGGFEQVGSLPEGIVSGDVSMTAEPGDIMLYSGNSVVIYYGTNTWDFTKLGHIQDLSETEIRELLAAENATMTFSLSEN